MQTELGENRHEKYSHKSRPMDTRQWIPTMEYKDRKAYRLETYEQAILLTTECSAVCTTTMGAYSLVSKMFRFEHPKRLVEIPPKYQPSKIENIVCARCYEDLIGRLETYTIQAR
jgi:uncharacterized protein with PIN domain